MAESQADLAYIADLVRTHDRPRYYSVLFAPKELRDDLLALYAFAAEVGRIADQVREPALGEIRLQWWRDSVEALSAGQAGGNPTLRCLAGAISRRSLPVQPLLALIEARTADLYSDPPATIGDLEGRLGETQSAVFQLASLVCGGAGPDSAEAAGHAGVAHGLALSLAAFSAFAAGGRAFVPAEVLASEGLEPADMQTSPPKPGVARVLGTMADLADRHLQTARRLLRSTPKKVWPAFLPLAVTCPLLAHVRRSNTSQANSPIVLSDLQMLIRIAWARIAGQSTGPELMRRASPPR
jgi:phytoene synthase